MRIQRLTPSFAVASQLARADFAEVAALGFKSVIANRPDGEEFRQLSAAECEKLAAAAGLNFQHLPLRMTDVLEPEAAAATRQALTALPGPVLAFCKSGTRSAIVWAASAVATEPIDVILDALRQADIKVPGLASELQELAASRP